MRQRDALMDYLRKTPEEPRDSDDSSFASLRVIDTDIEPGGAPAEAQNTDSLISKKRLINTFNHIHFKGGSVFIHFRHLSDNRTIKLAAKPQPCLNDQLVCLWTDPPNIQSLQTAYRFTELTAATAQHLISVPAAMRAISAKGICVTLPDKSVQHSARKTRRYACNPLDVDLIQNGVIFKGTLMEFSAFSFQVEIMPAIDEPIQWINTNNRMTLIIRNDNTPLYSDECRIIRLSGGSKRKNLVLAPISDTVQRFTPRVYRSKRIPLTPSPDIFFWHPFTGKQVSLKIIDISGSGVSAEDDEENSVLLPGMIIPTMTINFANSFHFDCKAQVVYRRTIENDSGKQIVKCGIAFMDMDSEEHMRLLSILHQAENKHVYICSKVDTDELWRFFFQTGFVYPQKYAFMHPFKDQIKKTYEKLYTENSSIARHFTWQKKGEIQAHLSMLRFYERTWLIHHLAALTGQHFGGGIEMLEQIGSFTYDAHRLVSSHMDYLICYFRPANRFPRHFFGGVAKNINNPKACSIDTFAYFHYRKTAGRTPPTGDWELVKPEFDDLVEFETCYEQQSGGLMIQSLDLMPDPEMSDRLELATEYQRLGLKRERRIYALKHHNLLKAVIMVNIADFAVNMSDLTNCITFFVTDVDGLPPEILYQSISALSDHYEVKKFPVLLFPSEYADRHSITYERTYHLWTLNMQHTDEYFKNYHYLL